MKETLRDACEALLLSCNGRIPLDSSDSVAVEAIHILRIAAALKQTPKGRPRKNICKQCRIWPVNENEDLCDECCGLTGKEAFR